jgi:hypothetical protein
LLANHSVSYLDTVDQSDGDPSHFVMSHTRKDKWSQQVTWLSVQFDDNCHRRRWLRVLHIGIPRRKAACTSWLMFLSAIYGSDISGSHTVIVLQYYCAEVGLAKLINVQTLLFCSDTNQYGVTVALVPISEHGWFTDTAKNEVCINNKHEIVF